MAGGGVLAALRPRLIDRYILAEAARPLAVSLGLVLTALLLERLLRLFNMLARSGGPFELVLEMVGNLVPHYLGLALPAAFFVSTLLVVGRLSEESELDAMLSSGLSIGRIAVPLLAAGLVFALFSVALYGFIQPYSRYAYRALLHVAVNAGWDAKVEPAAFASAVRDFTLTADDVDFTGRNLQGVFAQRIVDGREEVFTAETGALGLSPDRSRLILVLENGTRWWQVPGAHSNVVRFERLSLTTPFSPEAAPFRARGDSERELTLAELWQEMNASWSPVAPAKLRAEFHGRLVRALSLPLLPLLAIPLGMAAKRSRRGPGLVMAAVVLIFYHHGIQLGQSMAATARISPVLAAWIPFALFATLCLALFLKSQRRPGENPFTWAVERIAAAADAIAALFRRRSQAHDAGQAP